MLRPPDGHGGIERDNFHTPNAIRFGPVDAPLNMPGIRRVMFALDDIGDVVGACAHTINLPGHEVEFRYGHLPGGGRALAELCAE